MTDKSELSMFEIIQRERNQVERDLQRLYCTLAELVGTHGVRGSIPVDEIRALVPGLAATS